MVVSGDGEGGKVEEWWLVSGSVGFSGIRWWWVNPHTFSFQDLWIMKSNKNLTQLKKVPPKALLILSR